MVIWGLTRMSKTSRSRPSWLWSNMAALWAFALQVPLRFRRKRTHGNVVSAYVLSCKGGGLNDIVYVHRCKSSRCHVVRVFNPFICVGTDCWGLSRMGPHHGMVQIVIMKEIWTINSSAGRWAFYLVTKEVFFRGVVQESLLSCLPVDLRKHVLCSRHYTARDFFQDTSIPEAGNQTAAI